MKTLRKDLPKWIFVNIRGSLTIETAVVLPLFLSFFFLFLFIIKTACIQITLDSAVRGTAAEIASCAYPLTLLNELEDEMAAEQNGASTSQMMGPAGVRYNMIPGASPDFMGRLVSGQITESDLADVLDGMKGIREYLFANYGGIYYNLKDKGKYFTVKTILDKYIAGSYVKPEYLTLSFVEFPQSSGEYDHKKRSETYRQSGLIPGQNFDKDDVVIQVEYELIIPLPLLKNTITLTNTAVEKAWLAGGNGVYTDRKDKSVFAGEQELVYITRTGQSITAALAVI